MLGVPAPTGPVDLLQWCRPGPPTSPWPGSNGWGPGSCPGAAAAGCRPVPPGHAAPGTGSVGSGDSKPGPTPAARARVGGCCSGGTCLVYRRPVTPTRQRGRGGDALPRTPPPLTGPVSLVSPPGRYFPGEHLPGPWPPGRYDGGWHRRSDTTHPACCGTTSTADAVSPTARPPSGHRRLRLAAWFLVDDALAHRLFELRDATRSAFWRSGVAAGSGFTEGPHQRLELGPTALCAAAASRWWGSASSGT